MSRCLFEVGCLVGGYKIFTATYLASKSLEAVGLATPHNKYSVRHGGEFGTRPGRRDEAFMFEDTQESRRQGLEREAQRFQRGQQILPRRRSAERRLRIRIFMFIKTFRRGPSLPNGRAYLLCGEGRRVDLNTSTPLVTHYTPAFCVPVGTHPTVLQDFVISQYETEVANRVQFSRRETGRTSSSIALSTAGVRPGALFRYRSTCFAMWGRGPNSWHHRHKLGLK